MSEMRIAVVTGGNKGIGFGIVRSLCQKFPGIVFLTARDVGRGESAVKELEKVGLKPKFHQLDVTDLKSVETFRDYIKKNYRGIDVLVNNAAIAFNVASTEPFAVQAEQTMSVNFFSLQRVCKILFPLLRPHARVVNVSSSMGHLSKIPSEQLKTKLSNPDLTEEELTDLMNQFVDSAKKGKNIEDGWGSSAYCVSKVGVCALTFIQQRYFDEDAGADIAVNAVHPGYVDTDMTSHKGHLTIEQGADAPVFLSLLPAGTEIKGCYVWRDKKTWDWKAGATPAPV